jgi:hypothetical protein
VWAPLTDSNVNPIRDLGVIEPRRRDASEFDGSRASKSAFTYSFNSLDGRQHPPLDAAPAPQQEERSEAHPTRLRGACPGLLAVELGSFVSGARWRDGRDDFVIIRWLLHRKKAAPTSATHPRHAIGQRSHRKDRGPVPPRQHGSANGREPAARVARRMRAARLARCCRVLRQRRERCQGDRDGRGVQSKALPRPSHYARFTRLA